MPESLTSHGDMEERDARAWAALAWLMSDEGAAAIELTPEELAEEARMELAVEAAEIGECWPRCGGEQ